MDVLCIVKSNSNLIAIRDETYGYRIMQIYSDLNLKVQYKESATFTGTNN